MLCHKCLTADTQIPAISDAKLTWISM